MATCQERLEGEIIELLADYDAAFPDLTRVNNKTSQLYSIMVQCSWDMNELLKYAVENNCHRSIDAIRNRGADIDHTRKILRESCSLARGRAERAERGAVSGCSDWSIHARQPIRWLLASVPTCGRAALPQERAALPLIFPYIFEGYIRPLEIALKHNHYETTEALLKAGANLAITNGPLYIAIKNRSLESVNLLLKYNAQVNVVDGYNQTPLLLASSMNQGSICQVLLSKGAKLNGSIINDPLYHAVKQRNIELTELLIKAGANTSSIYFCIMDEHSTLLEIAISNSDWKMIITLLFHYQQEKKEPDLVALLMPHFGSRRPVSYIGIFRHYAPKIDNTFKLISIQLIALAIFQVYNDYANPISSNNIYRLEPEHYYIRVLQPYYSIDYSDFDFLHNYNACIEELSKLHNIPFGENHSLLDILTKTPKQLDRFFSQHRHLYDAFYEENDYQQTFPIFYGFLAGQIDRALYIPKVKTSLDKLCKFTLPPEIAILILDNLYIDDHQTLYKMYDDFYPSITEIQPELKSKSKLRRFKKWFTQFF